eukprot:178622_1
MEGNTLHRIWNMPIEQMDQQCGSNSLGTQNVMMDEEMDEEIVSDSVELDVPTEGNTLHRIWSMPIEQMEQQCGSNSLDTQNVMMDKEMDEEIDEEMVTIS